MIGNDLLTHGMTAGPEDPQLVKEDIFHTYRTLYPPSLLGVDDSEGYRDEM